MAGRISASFSRMASIILVPSSGRAFWPRTSPAASLGLQSPRAGRWNHAAAFPWRRTILTLLALACGACSGDDEVTGATSRCANGLFKPYDPKVMEQCVAACGQCEHGTIVTCSTSCKLKGAR
jgi:hypothetical protein